MNTELFGVFGDRATFERHRPQSAFDRVVEGDRVTVGVSDVALDITGRTATHSDEEGACVVWGEAYVPETVPNSAAWLLDRYRTVGADALSELNGSYLAVVETDDEAFVATDQARTWECFYTDAPGVRVFGSDPTAVARTVEEPTVRRDALVQFALMGLVVGEGTVFDELARVPFDSRLFRDSTDELRRFVYDPQEFDYVGELAARLERAVRRRAGLPGSKGLLLSAGFDSRTILGLLPELDATYTVGRPDGTEAQTAARLADQFETPHRTLDPAGTYLNTEWRTIRYAQGIKESLHIHHAGHTDEMDVDTVYHGLLFDTFLRGHFLPRDSYEILGRELPRTSLRPDSDPVETLLEDKFGFIRACDEYGVECPTAGGDSAAFAREVLEREREKWADRCPTAYDEGALLGIQNQPTTAFRTHLADHFVESFVAADAELLDWHLKTPPEYRNTRTLVEAIKRIDESILRHRPPDRPHESKQLNAVEQFVRSKAPLLRPFERSWPDRRYHYERQHLDQKLFSTHPEVHGFPVRFKLRLNDVTCWVNNVDDSEVLTPSSIVSPPTAKFSLADAP